MANSSVCLSTLFENNIKHGLVFQERVNEHLMGYIIDINHVEIDRICELVIQCQSNLLLENLRKQSNDYKEFNQGFLIHHWSLEKLKDILSSLKSLLICIIDTNKNNLAGYLLLTSSTYFHEDTNSQYGDLILDNNLITNQQWIQFISSPDIHYIKQIGVDKDYHRQGIATYLVKLSKTQSNQGLCTLVMLSPFSNMASENCFRKSQFQSIAIWNQRISEGFGPFKATLFIWPSFDSY
ncbi:hypothetical protein I4U23_023367 [Adineta vaga]|nr:hypothetical protein I4U23_023367 [Adineta vaga]